MQNVTVTPAIIDADELVERYKAKKEKKNETNVEVNTGPLLGLFSSFTLHINIKNQYQDYPNVEIKNIEINDNFTYLKVIFFESRHKTYNQTCFFKKKSQNYWIINEKHSL